MPSEFGRCPLCKCSPLYPEPSGITDRPQHLQRPGYIFAFDGAEIPVLAGQIAVSGTVSMEKLFGRDIVEV